MPRKSSKQTGRAEVHNDDEVLSNDPSSEVRWRAAMMIGHIDEDLHRKSLLDPHPDFVEVSVTRLGMALVPQKD